MELSSHEKQKNCFRLKETRDMTAKCSVFLHWVLDQIGKVTLLVQLDKFKKGLGLDSSVLAIQLFS